MELEPPRGTYNLSNEGNSSIEEELVNYLDRVDMISITNRPVFGLSAITMAKRVHKFLREHNTKQIRVSIHLTTRLSHFDMFRSVLDAHRMGLTDILPLLGDPRGPNNESYFKNGLDLLGFISYLKSGETNYLSDKYQKMHDSGNLVDHIENAKYNIGSVVDLNPTKQIKNKIIDVRKKQIKLSYTKEQLGAEYLISQGIFDAKHYFDFLDETDLKIPIIPGVIPARLRLIEQFGLPIDTLNKQRLRAAMTTMEEREVGNKIAETVYQELQDGGCKNIHIYSLGNSNNFDAITNFHKSVENNLNKEKQK